MAAARLSHYLGAAVRGIRSGSLFDTMRRFWVYGQLERSVGARFRYIVQAGPFKGMQYISITPYRALIPKLIGTYERELHPIIESALTHGYQRLINVGSAEGYYAVGMAWKLPTLEVFAFDMAAREQALCRELSAANGVTDRVHVLGECTVDELARLAQPNTLIIIDCEGCERALLDPAKAPGLLQTDILIEIHEFVFPDIPDVLRSRFEATHEIRVIPFAGRIGSDYPLIAFLSDSDRERAVFERGEALQVWWYLSRREQ